jgi:hypothetical protein
MAGFQHNVGWLHVAVDDALFMGVGQGIGDLTGDLDRSLDGDLSLLGLPSSE